MNRIVNSMIKKVMAANIMITNTIGPANITGAITIIIDISIAITIASDAIADKPFTASMHHHHT